MLALALPTVPAVVKSRAFIFRAGLSGLVISTVTPRQLALFPTCLSPCSSASAARFDPRYILVDLFYPFLDSTMSSDEDTPLTALAGANGKNHVTINGNGHPNGVADDSSMSEDDMPLVCICSALCSPPSPYNSC